MNMFIKNICLYCFIIIGLVSCRAQFYVRVPSAYMDFEISTNFIDSLRKKGITNFIIYQTTINDSIQNINNNYSDMVTYIIWSKKEDAGVILITDSSVLQLQNALSNKIFSYKNFNNLWIKKDEDVYKVVPDYAEPYEKDIVIYITPENKRFFELGRNAFYKLNANRNKYRKEFIGLLKCLVLNSNNEWVKIGKNQRE